MSFGEKIKELRKERHLTQEELAIQLDIKKHCLSDWETNRSTPNGQQLIRIADYFQLSLQSLLDLPLLIQSQIPLEEQINYIDIKPRTNIEEKLFLKLKSYPSEQLQKIIDLIQIIKQF